MTNTASLLFTKSHTEAVAIRTTIVFFYRKQ